VRKEIFNRRLDIELQRRKNDGFSLTDILKEERTRLKFEESGHAHSENTRL